MDNVQRAKLDSYLRVNDFNTTYATDLATIPDYSTLQADFESNVTAIQKAGGVQATPKGASDDTVSTAKSTMATTVIKYAMRGSVKAKMNGDFTLFHQLDEPYTYIFSATKNEADERANDLRNLLNDNLNTLTTVSAANISEIDKAIQAYTNVKNESVEAVQSVKSGGTDLLPKFFETADADLDSMFTLVRSFFADTDVEMVDAMALAMEIINTGIRHTSIDISAADGNGNALPSVSVMDEQSGKIYTSNLEGVVHIGTHKSGASKLTISSGSLAPVTMVVQIVRGTENKFSVVLK